MRWTYYNTFEIDADQMWRLYLVGGLVALIGVFIGYSIGYLLAIKDNAENGLCPEIPSDIRELAGRWRGIMRDNPVVAGVGIGWRNDVVVVVIQTLTRRDKKRLKNLYPELRDRDRFHVEATGPVIAV